MSVLAGVGGIAAYAAPEAAVENHFETGIVDISLQEYMKNEAGEEKEWSPQEAVLPGMEISKIPRITNEGSDCFVRVKFEFEGIDMSADEDIYGMDDAVWTKAEDGYYYYRNVLGTEESVDVFQGIRIPDDLSQEEYEGQSFQLDIDADAVQAANFTPDFEAPEPWGKVEILECTKEGEYDITTFKKENQLEFQVEYQGSAGTMTANPDDFFSNMPYLMPGDTYTDSAVMKNSGESDIRIYFRGEVPEEDNQDQSDILDRISLLIEAETQEGRSVVYDGPLRGETLGETICLGTIPAGGKGEFIYTVYMPEELNNDYSLLHGSVRWIFSTEEIVKEQVSVQTGDNENLGFGLLGCGVSLGLLTAVRYMRQRTLGSGGKEGIR